MTTPMIAVDGLRVRRAGHTVLEIPPLAVAAGEVLAVIGPNGAGKSTLLQALALLVPAEMNYRFAGRQVQIPAEALSLRRQMAFVFQEPLLLDATAFENVALGLRLRGATRADIRDRVYGWLSKLRIEHLAPRHARTLSGGEAQRVSLARALALQPRVLFLDEPFSALDVLTRPALLQDLRPILKAAGVTTLFVTHDFLEIPALADRVAVMADGRMVQVGSLQELFERPADAAVGSVARAAADLLSAVLQPR